jgi:hypothetical protein
MRSLLRDRDDNSEPEIAIELYFDDATEQAILDLRNVLYEDDVVPEPGIIEARPHISLTILEGDEIPFDLLHGFAGATAPRKVQLTSLAGFAGSSGVLFLAPTPDDRLLGLHRDLHERLRNSAFASRQAYEPEVWVPHCTLEKDIPAADMGRAFAALLRAFEPIDGSLVQVGAVRYPPLEAVEIAPLGGDSEAG